MTDTPQIPSPSDVVLGSQLAAPSSGVVLGGIEAVKAGLASTSEKEQIAALTEALNYGDAGLSLVVQALASDSLIVRVYALNQLKIKDKELTLQQVLNSNKEGTSMTHQKIPVQLDQKGSSGVVVVSATAFFDGKNLKVMGELAAENTAVKEYRKVEVVVYDLDKDIVGRDYTNWSKFGSRQSFEINIKPEKLYGIPAKINVFAATG